MISNKIESFFAAHEETYLTPANKLAVIIDTHNMDHAKLLLSHMSYSRVPVVTEDNYFVGTIGLREIIQYQMENGLSDDELNQDISLIVEATKDTIPVEFELADVLRKLVDVSFLPVVADDGRFVGIITRKSILKAVNSLVHTVDICKKSKS